MMEFCGVSVLQFGTGRFLRAFVDRFVAEANAAGQAVGQIVAVQSTGGERSDLLNGAGEGFGVWVRGMEAGVAVERFERVRSVQQGLAAATEWPQALGLAESPELKWIVSNTTEAGYALADGDCVNSSPPASFPAKLTQILWRRFQSGRSPLTILPCELIERNACVLRGTVRGVAEAWALPTEFVDWLQNECVWLNTLVDCIVTPAPAEVAAARRDPLLVCAEPYRLWAIERPAHRSASLFTHRDIQVVDDLSPYYLRKVRILNGAHTAMAGKFLPQGFETVLQVMQDRETSRWVRGLIFEEIVPTLCARVAGTEDFALSTIDRLRNPYLQHRLSDIAKNQAEKRKVRLEPTRQEYERLFGRPPARIMEALSD